MSRARRTLDLALLAVAGVVAWKWLVKPALPALNGMDWIALDGLDGQTRIMHDGSGAPLMTDGQMVYRNGMGGKPIPIMSAKALARATSRDAARDRMQRWTRNEVARTLRNPPLRYGPHANWTNLRGLGDLGRFKLRRAVSAVSKPVARVVAKTAGTVRRVAPKAAVAVLLPQVAIADKAMKAIAPKQEAKLRASIKEYGVPVALVGAAAIATVATGGAAAPALLSTGGNVFAQVQANRELRAANREAAAAQREYDAAVAAENAAAQQAIAQEAQSQDAQTTDVPQAMPYDDADSGASTIDEPDQNMSRPGWYDGEIADTYGNGRIPGAPAEVSERGRGDPGIIDNEPDEGFTRPDISTDDGLPLDTENAAESYDQPGDPSVGVAQQGDSAAWVYEPDFGGNDPFGSDSDIVNR